MADTSSVLIDTLKYPNTPQLTGDNKQDIQTLQSSYHPGMTQAFSAVMQTVARMAYNDRQQAETNQLSKQFDPTKVSGGTFRDIMGWVEQKRGVDTSKVYGATMQGYTASQQEIGTQLDRLKAEEKEKADELRSLRYQFPDADIKEGDDEQTIAAKIKKSNERKVVLDLFTQTFGYYPEDLSINEMNKRLAKKYKNYDKYKEDLQIAAMEQNLAKSPETNDEQTAKTEKERTAWLDDAIAEAKKGSYGSDTKAVKSQLKEWIKQYYPGWEWVVDKQIPDEYMIPNISKSSSEWG